MFLHLKLLLSTFFFFVFLCKEKFRIESVRFCKGGSFQRPRFTAISGYLKNASFGNFCDVVLPEGSVDQTWDGNRWYK